MKVCKLNNARTVQIIPKAGRPRSPIVLRWANSPNLKRETAVSIQAAAADYDIREVAQAAETFPPKTAFLHPGIACVITPDDDDDADGAAARLTVRHTHNHYPHTDVGQVSVETMPGAWVVRAAYADDVPKIRNRPRSGELAQSR